MGTPARCVLFESHRDGRVCRVARDSPLRVLPRETERGFSLSSSFPSLFSSFPFLFTASSSSSSFSSLLSLSSRYNNLDFTRTTTRYTLRGGSNFRRCGCLFPLSFSSSFFLFLFFFFFDARGMFCLFVGFDYRCMISVNADVTSAISSDSTVSAVARIFLGHTREFSNEFPTCHVQERRPRSTPPSRRSPCDLPSKSVARRPLDIVRPSSSSTSLRIPPHLGTLGNNIPCRWIYLFFLFSREERREFFLTKHRQSTLPPIHEERRV